MLNLLKVRSIRVNKHFIINNIFCQMIREKVILFFILSLFISCAPASHRVDEPNNISSDNIYNDGYSQIGIASWYGVEEHGRPTATGERFTMYGYTAAHRTLPMGTIIRITNLENGRDVIVKVNDRGPFVEGRIVDLSHAAAKSIDMIDNGTAKVKVEVISSPGRTNNYFEAMYTVQIGSFSEKQNALNLKKELDTYMNDIRIETIEVGNVNYYRVRVGRFQNKKDAEKINYRLSKYGYDGKVILE